MTLATNASGAPEALGLLGTAIGHNRTEVASVIPSSREIYELK